MSSPGVYFLGDDIDDPCGAFCIVLGRRRGDHFNGLDLVSWDLLSASATLLAVMVEGLLLISTRMFWLPRKETFPSISTESIGTRFSTSVASPPSQFDHFQL